MVRLKVGQRVYIAYVMAMHEHMTQIKVHHDPTLNFCDMLLRINHFKTSREEKYVPNKPIKASVVIKLITVSQPHVITKKDVNSDSNGLSSTGVNNTAKTRRPQPRSNIKNDRVPTASKSSCSKNKEVERENTLGTYYIPKNRNICHLK
ncbi:hypothetical protein Tco_1508840 [Tanacetum coccineum]